MTRDEVLAQLREGFKQVPRPEVFVRNPGHCCECSEHNDTLAAHTPETIGIAQLGNPGWDPICFASDQAFVYFLPAMIRLAFDPESFYLGQLLFHLNVPDRVTVFTAPQASAVLDALWALQEALAVEIESCKDEYRMEEAMQRLENVIREERA